MIVETNRRLVDQLDDREYAIRFAENVKQMEVLFWEIIDHADVECSVPFKRRTLQAKFKDSFHPIFSVTAPQDIAAPSTQQPQEVLSTERL